MTDDVTTTAGGTLELAQALAGTLLEEERALTRLAGLFEEQLEALRMHQSGVLDHATTRTTEEISTLGQIRHTRERQVRLLCRMLRVTTNPSILALTGALNEMAGAGAVAAELQAIRERVRTRAEAAQARCDEMEFALQYAIQLGREIVQTLQGVGGAGSARVYTAAGGTRIGTPSRSLLNTKG